MNKAAELITASQEVGVASHVLTGEAATAYIKQVLARFSPQKTTGHLAIQHDSITVPLEPNEFTYSQYLPAEPVFVFFDQQGPDAGHVVVIELGNRLCDVLANAYGMEYFASNQAVAYLLAVNWYVIEATGTATEWLTPLATGQPAQ